MKLNFFYYICKNIQLYTKVFVVLADEPRKFIYGKRRQSLRAFARTYMGAVWA